MSAYYKGIKILLASMHKKEKAISPAFNKILGCEIFVPDNFDTDQFGTFSGEITRKLSAYETLKNKALDASKIFNYDYVISSEGSFGPHPDNFLMVSDVEMLLLYDRKLDLLIADYLISTNTNHSQFLVTKDNYSTKDYFDWLSYAKFPSHALILKHDSSILYKGISSFESLEKYLLPELEKYGKLSLETDMRAMMNPTRMGVINELSYKLAKRISNLCKKCGTPGFGKLEYTGHLICSWCDQETKVAKYKYVKCLRCDYFESEEINSGKNTVDPMHCQYCNP
jgi:hypothetical protein